ncbi:hypothetical protein UFOVP529_116 [uncultured Caudovirales phage]|uniref:Uncharacterized protein n=1 Tax=uncultured Caudovirales phage TaxID=2100421 RepID=A0A6J5MRI5_9CAUD|nr:hypothetical protein UFOVP529_116 [uncultured Caudovirales phage]CAB4190364.1 hypothetical protein UFOVP1191_54 [uncultured Caudovirales phage]CAB4194275.1 hypothetical protein UFOVP1252_5 [uncultured Caudovirales phage]
MDALKDLFLAAAWTVTSLPKKAKKRLASAAKSASYIWPKVVNEVVAQSWTVFGLLVGWVVLPDGETRDFVGVVLFWLVIAWVVTMPLRISSED